MNAHELIGLVAVRSIHQFQESRDSADTTVARFLLDRLTGEQVAEICRHILDDPRLKTSVEIKLPRQQYAEADLPDTILTDERTTYWRNTSCEKPILILANNDDDQLQSLRELTPLGSKELKNQVALWVKVASNQLLITTEHQDQWVKALQGLQRASTCTLEMFAEYVVNVSNYMQMEGVTLIDALGWALPSLEVPRDTGYFQSLPEKHRTTTSKWQKMYQDVINKRGCLLRKHLPNQQRIDDAELKTQFAQVKDQISSEAYTSIEQFIVAPDDWTPESMQLAQFEWDRDGISGLFTGLRVQRVDLATETIAFFNYEDPSELTSDDQDYLTNLSGRKKSESGDEDAAFYERHHLTLSKNRSLKAKWDHFIYGKPIECTDFIVGLLACVERLLAQTGSSRSEMIFSVKLPAYERSKNKWISNLNHDVGLYFCTRYRGLEDLTRSVIEWDTGYLFTYDALLNDYRNQHKDSYNKNRSTSREATQLKFLIASSYKVGGRIEQATIQLIWKCYPNTIGMELHDDLRRLASKPFLLTTVNREPVSKKGHLQEIALDDIDTFDAAYSQDRGSLISAITKAIDITKTFPSKLQEALKDGRITLAGRDEIKAAWEHFAKIYNLAITHFLNDEGLASDYLLEQADAYNKLLQTLREYASGDKNRVDLWHPLLRLGVVSVLGNKPAAIVAPWQPLRLFALAIKARQFARFISYICKNTTVDLGDDRLFFFHLKSDMEHPYYPEVSIGFQGGQPKLLSLSDTVNDYSLMEIPLREGNEQTTNENPREAAEKVGEVVRRYLDLQPHKKASLSIALYNCDSKGLPEAVVGKLANLYETKSSNEVCCQIVLRHQHMSQLSKLYEKMVETAETHPEAFIASESENDFMSRLRIGIMATDVDNITNAQEKKTDIVFLQDVISRQAQIIWLENVTDQYFPDPLQHFPARWSRRHPTAYGDLRSAVYLVCPSQPLVGQTYLDTLHDTVAEQLRPGEHVLPARQVSFQDANTQRIFQEVHQLGEWVVNYDDLLERRLLQHQKVTVIKYQQNRAQDRNLIISSTSSFQLLQVLVRQRLEKLNLPSELGTEAIAHKCIEQAKSISGDIVLRAARRGVHASELIGLVLSQHLLSSEIQDEDPVGWFFLDDYANWLGQDEQQIADIMALVLEKREQRRVLKIIISEAKYVEGNIAETRKTSQKQLKETVKRIQDALFKDPGSLDRDIWLTRLSDLLIDGVVVNSRQTINLRQWANLLRRGEILLEVKGYSHVFAPFIDTQTLHEDTQTRLAGVQNCFQETFGHKEIQELVQCFARGKSALPLRESLGDEKPWRAQNPQLPGKDQFLMAISPMRQLSEQQIAEQSHYASVSKGTNLTDNQSPAQESSVRNGSSSSPETTAHPSQTDQWIKGTVETLKRALRSYELQTNVLGTRLTPNALLIRLKGSDRLRVEDIEKKQSVLLTTHSLKLLHIIAQPGEIVVSIERKQRETVSLHEIWKQRTLFAQPGEINFCYVVGIKELDGDILYLNVGQKIKHIPIQAPHTLIAGTTGSGKSVLMQNLLLDICRTNTSAQAHIYLIDPKKGVDYQQLLNLPHLFEGIITEQDKAQEILASLIAQMDYRYTLFAQAKVNSLVDYNRRVAPQDQLPVLWLVHDEFADWMLVREYKEAVSASVQRLGSKARAAGIYLIFAAQRPDANVLPLQLRDNLGNRLILRVESTGTSEIALGEKGAEKLLGKGHVAAKVNGEIILAQVPFLSLEEQYQIVEEICQHERQDTPPHLF